VLFEFGCEFGSDIAILPGLYAAMRPMPSTRAKMHQTTVRFGADLWAQLEREAASTGVSAAQYVREATLSRLTYSAAQRGEGFGAGSAEGAAAARADAAERQSDSSAVWAQARLARERARSVRKAARETQAAVGGARFHA
jgi:hypothetical protein